MFHVQYSIFLNMCYRLFLLLSSLLFIGAGTNKITAQSVKISSYAADNTYSGIPIFLVPADSIKNNSNSLVNKSHLSLIVKSLTESGFQTINDTIGLKSFLFLEYDYSISGPALRNGKAPLPTYAPTTTVNTNVNVYTDIQTQSKNNSNASGIINPIVTEPLNFPHPLFPFGFLPVYYDRNIYTRKLLFKCYKIKDSNVQELWITNIESKGPSSDLNEILPVMIFASKNYYGKNLGVPKEITINNKAKSFRKFIGN